MSPLDFIKNPLLWMRLIEKYKVEVSPAAPFSLGLCVDRAESSGTTYDCSSLIVMPLGGEPFKVSEEKVQKLNTLFGIKAEVLQIAYGKCIEIHDTYFTHYTCHGTTVPNIVDYDCCYYNTCMDFRRMHCDYVRFDLYSKILLCQMI